MQDANPVSLTAAVRRYRAADQKEVEHLKALLQTARAIPFPDGKSRPARAHDDADPDSPVTDTAWPSPGTARMLWLTKPPMAGKCCTDFLFGGMSSPITAAMPLIRCVAAEEIGGVLLHQQWHMVLARTVPARVASDATQLIRH